MEKERLVLILFAIIAFLLPVGMYCLILSSINRRARPVMASGVWDAIGLLFAVSGFLFAVIPILITEFYRRTTGLVDEDTKLVTLWLGHWAVWLAYFLFLGSAGWLMVLLRANKTTIYNVDLEMFTPVLERTFSVVGLDAQRDHARLVLTPVSAAMTDTGTAIMETPPKRTSVVRDQRFAELQVETFPAMCNVTLHWGKCAPGVRAEIETELHKSLEGAAPLENPAAGWFMTVSGLILGATTALIAAMGFLLIVGGR